MSNTQPDFRIVRVGTLLRRVKRYFYKIWLRTKIRAGQRVFICVSRTVQYHRALITRVASDTYSCLWALHSRFEVHDYGTSEGPIVTQ